MTNEEAIKYWRDFLGEIPALEEKYIEDEGTVNMFREQKIATKLAISALEKQEKYKWHDLRKTPEDLPERGTHIVYLYLFKRDGYGRSILSSNTCYYGRHSLDDWGAYKYIAWKECGFEEIEPFEEA